MSWTWEKSFLKFKVQLLIALCRCIGGQLSITFLYTIWVSKHNGKNRISLISAVQKIQLKEGGYVLAKKWIDTLKWIFLFDIIIRLYLVTQFVSPDRSRRGVWIPSQSYRHSPSWIRGTRCDFWKLRYNHRNSFAKVSVIESRNFRVESSIRF